MLVDGRELNKRERERGRERAIMAHHFERRSQRQIFWTFQILDCHNLRGFLCLAFCFFFRLGSSSSIVQYQHHFLL